MGLSLRPDHRWHSQANGMEPAVLIRNSQKTLYGLIWLGSFALVMGDYADGRRNPWGQRVADVPHRKTLFTNVNHHATLPSVFTQTDLPSSPPTLDWLDTFPS